MIRRVPRAVGRWLALVVLLVSCSAGAADPAKVLRVALPRAETGFDPAMASEIYSSAVIAAIMEPLLTFDYLARPVKVIPLTAAALPEITDNGRTYTFRIKPGIFFSDDPAFKGKRRELTADDYVYAIKRLVDPAMRSPNAFYVAGKIVGLDDVAAAAARPGAHFDYGAKIAGLEVMDRHTLRIRLTGSRLHVRERHGVAEPQRGRARGRRSVPGQGGGASRRNRPVHPEIMGSGIEDHARSQPRVSRVRLEFRRGRRSR